MSDHDNTEPAQTFNDLLRQRLQEKAARTPQQLAADAIEAANEPTFNDLLRGNLAPKGDES